MGCSFRTSCTLCRQLFVNESTHFFHNTWHHMASLVVVIGMGLLSALTHTLVDNGPMVLLCNTAMKTKNSSHMQRE